MKKRKSTAAIGLALVAAGLALACSLLVPYAGELAASDYSEYVSAAAQEEGNSFPTIDWDALTAVNPDVVGWVRVEGTPIDYPVVQARHDDPQRYLNCALDGTWNGHGCPYVDAGCSGTGSPMVLTYGHNMLDGTMYSAFAGFTDQAYFDAHREILFLTPARNHRLGAVAALEVSAWNHYPRIDFPAPGDLEAYLASERAAASATGPLPGRVAKACEFVCCSYGQDNGRTIVYAVEHGNGA